MGVISSLFPGLAAKRAQHKLSKLRTDMMIGTLERRFEGAAGGRRNDGWRSAGSDSNVENAPALARLRNRARDLRRNNPYAERAITGIADNVVGAGIVPRAKARRDRDNDRLGELWRAWAETVACDADGLENFYGLQHKIMEAIVTDGECLIRRRRRFSSDGLPVPVQMQVLEADFLDETKDGAYNNNRIIQGVEFDVLGKRAAYWLFDEHPGSNSSWSSLTSRRVPAEDVIHVYLGKRPGQARGYSWLSPVMQRLRNFDEMEDAVMEQAKIAACFAAFVSKDESRGSTSNARPPLIERIEPGIIQELSLGESVSFASPPTFNGYTTYASQVLHAIAVGLGIPYELLAADLKGVNFSSGRMGWLHFARRVDVWQWRMLIPQLCDQVWRWFMEGQVLLPGGVTEAVLAEWVPPRRDMVDPKAETENIKERIRNGLTTWPDALRELGVTDPKRHAEDIKKSNDLLDDLGLILDCDPRKVGAAGTPSQQANPEEKPDDANSEAGDDEQDA
ncbi:MULTISPECIES: phage portal protein [Pseudomonas chlororaphis group]|uniref:phage portal protein n=1 Tax=Pseudomonas chlororaphis group TaxID=136842 RepID=UPI002097ABCD|nr:MULTISPECIES: phage portal protein [Pseudomonas chlororaphis group]MCO7576177.1 phage portal protein [Pseudomonas protegens]MCO7580985.1 phage portal protein [Pseudomonas chlororaphis]MCO7597990.1 phage portal protein [Pseudomonas chlororaphis]